MERYTNGSVALNMKKMTEKFFDPFSPVQINVIIATLDRMELFGVDRHEVFAMHKEYMDAKQAKLKADESRLQKKFKKINAELKSKPVKPSKPAKPAKSAKPGKTADKVSRKLCAKCGSATKSFRVNISKCTMVGGGYKIAIMCTDKDCKYTEYK